MGLTMARNTLNFNPHMGFTGSRGNASRVAALWPFGASVIGTMAITAARLSKATGSFAFISFHATKSFGLGKR
jgi:hypothetical protein